MAPAWAYFGYDEPNYTYAPNGRKLIGELGALGSAPVFIRAHNLLTTGDGTPALKWGSTNAYTEDANGKPIFDFTITDKIFDTYLAAHAKPFVEIGFMPEAMSTHPTPYKHTWPKGGIDTGWAYPPKDYGKWGELVYQWAKHCGEKYGNAEAESWYWEVWNEPDIMYWHGTPEEYDKLYDFAVAAVKRALPNAAVGGPASTGPAGTHAAEFLRRFLKHCEDANSPLDFISFHAKGKPELMDPHDSKSARMGIAREMQDVAKGFEIVASFPKFQRLPIVLSEADPEGCAACSAKDHPQNGYRNGALYAAYTASAMNGILRLAEQYKVNLRGMLTWAFEFEDQPYFAGLRTLATNGVDKPILNFFRMAGLMNGERIKAHSSAALSADELRQKGTQESADIGLLASKADQSMSILVWNYSDNATASGSRLIDLAVQHLPRQSGRVKLRHYRIDETHSNAYSMWKQMGSPQSPSEEQYKQLEAAGQLQLLGPPKLITAEGSGLNLQFPLPANSLSLVELSW
jgi:xylan 1,4-beta-xylosidase